MSGLRDFVPDDIVQREWVVFVLDVGALLEAKKCLENSYWDSICGISIWGENDFQKHFQDKHSNINVSNPRQFMEFKRVLLEPGAAHIEENFNSNWLSDEINYKNFVETMIISTGFSEKQAYYQGATIGFFCIDVSK
jgi:hypothetical protein